MPLTGEHPIQQSYEDSRTAEQYVEARFSSELMRLLHERQVQVINRTIAQMRPVWTLEIAAGPARITRAITAMGRLVALEFNEAMIKLGRPQTSEVCAWVQGNAFQLPFDGETFDLVYSFRFIRHFRGPDRNRLYTEVRRVLRPGGLFLFDAVNRKVSLPLRLANPDAYPIYDKLYRDKLQLQRELRRAGFETVCIEDVQRCFSLQYKVQVLVGPRNRTLCRWLIWALEAAMRGPGLEWIVTVVKKN